MAIGLTPSTATKIKAMLTQAVSLGAPTSSGQGKGTSRFDIHVRVTGPEDDGYYPCVTTSYNCATEAWDSYTATSYCFSSTGGKLAVGKRYRAINYGSIDGDLVFAVDTFVVPQEEVGCGLIYDKGIIAVDLESIAGCGLAVYQDPDSGSGSGSGGSGEPCEVLEVNPYDLAGCGLAVDPDLTCGLMVDVPSLANHGLQVVGSSGQCQSLKVKVCSTTWNEFVGSSLSISGTTITLTTTHQPRRLVVNSGGVCHEAAGSPVVATSSVTLPCTTKEVVTDVYCDGDEMVGTTETITYVPCTT